jgi:hypothetical protein
MNLYLKRIHKTNKSVIGELSVDGIFECYTLEDVEREVKIKGVTAIPKGTYKVGISMSNRFKKELPILFNVPNFEGVRIHSGNVAENTEGCILVGETRTLDFIGNSRKALDQLFAKMKLAKEITLTIE